MSSPDVTDGENIEADVDEFIIRLGSLEESLESLHDKLDIVLAAIDDRDDTTLQSTKPNESN